MAASSRGGAAGLEIWGILNVTPDSFSDGGRFLGIEHAVSHGLRMVEEGAHVLDVGGESSRPPGRTYGAGAARVPLDEELRRVIPVIERLRAQSSVTLSVDTTKAEVARAALAAGATIVNDVSCGRDDALVSAVSAAGASLVLMHTRGDGRVDPAASAGEGVVSTVRAELSKAAERAVELGVDPARVWIDPGIGFAKTAQESLTLLGNLDVLVATGYSVLVGASRKSFIAGLYAGGAAPPPERRLGGSLAAVAAAVLGGCHGVRVHDVYESAQAARVTAALRTVGAPAGSAS